MRLIVPPRHVGALFLVAGAFGCAGTDPAGHSSEERDLRTLLSEAGVVPLATPTPVDPALARLGQALFFDKILSGNRDIGCSTCHNPVYFTSDMLMLSIGTGGHRPGGSRQLGTGGFTTRHTTDLFNRGDPGWRSLMWDGRVELAGGTLRTPLGAGLPPGLDGPLAAQALLPLLARVEMRGHGADELASVSDTEPTLVYARIMARLRGVPGYDTLFASAFPGVPGDSLGIAHVANAIAAFIGDRWRADDSAFDQYLLGDSLALSEAALRGATLFFGRAGCGHCHSGPLLTDQEFHNTGLSSLGPGLPEGGPDIGRAAVTGRVEDHYRFRTPPLRNVALTSPYMHNGAFRSLEEAVRHYINPTESLQRYDLALVDTRLRSTLRQSPDQLADILATLDPRLSRPLPLAARDVDDLVAFLKALIDPGSRTLLQDIPLSVPSGLPVFDH